MASATAGAAEGILLSSEVEAALLSEADDGETAASLTFPLSQPLPPKTATEASSSAQRRRRNSAVCPGFFSQVQSATRQESQSVQFCPSSQKSSFKR